MISICFSRTLCETSSVSVMLTVSYNIDDAEGKEKENGDLRCVSMKDSIMERDGYSPCV